MMTNALREDSGRSEQLRQYFAARLPNMVSSLQSLVEAESPSQSPIALNACAEVLARYVQTELGVRPLLHKLDPMAPPCLQVDLGDTTPDVVMVGHFDTVHPIGTLATSPFRIVDDNVFGPGVLDMKAGLVLMVETARYLQQLPTTPNIRLLFNSDEELGSKYSGPIFRRAAQGAQVGLIFESSSDAATLKTAARGVRELRITAHGHAGHVAYPELWINPVHAIAEVVLQVDKLHRPKDGVVVASTMVQGSTAGNAVPDDASVYCSVRASSDAHLDAAEKAIRAITVSDPRITLDFEIVISTPTFENRSDNLAFGYAQEASRALGLVAPIASEARGASDANQLAKVVPHLLEGLGGWGQGLHNPINEQLALSSMVPSAMRSAYMVEAALLDLRFGIDRHRGHHLSLVDGAQTTVATTQAKAQTPTLGI